MPKRLSWKKDMQYQQSICKGNKSTNWLNKTFKLVVIYYNALIEDSEGNQYLRNRVHFKKYQFNKSTQQQLVD